jgi:hypothetical protein
MIFQTAAVARDFGTLSREELIGRLVVNADTLQQRELYELVYRRPFSDNDIVVPWVETHADELQPLFLLDLAVRLQKADPAGAYEWWAVARARIEYDVARCLDQTAGYLAGFLIHGGYPDKRDTSAAFERALNKKDLFVDNISPAWICAHGVGLYEPSVTPPFDRDMRVKPAAEWAAIKEKIRLEMVSFTGRRNASGIQRLLPKYDAWTIALSSDGKLLASEGGTSHHVTVWETETGRRRFEMGLGMAGFSSLAFTHDGKYLVTARATADPNDPSTANLWDATTGTLAGRVDGPYPGPSREGPRDNNARLLALSPDGRILAAVTDNHPECLVSLYETDHWTRVRSIRAATLITSLAFSPDGQKLAAGGILYGVWLYDLSTGTELWHALPEVSNVPALAFSPDGRYVAVGDAYEIGGHDESHRAIPILSSVDGAVARILPYHFLSINSLAWTADGRRLLTASQDGGVRSWDAQGNGDPETVLTFGEGPAAGGASAIALSPDGKRLAATGGSYAVILDLAAVARNGDHVRAEGGICRGMSCSAAER